MKEPPAARAVMMGKSWPAHVSSAYATPMPPSSSAHIWAFTSPSLIAPAGGGGCKGGARVLRQPAHTCNEPLRAALKSGPSPPPR